MIVFVPRGTPMMSVIDAAPSEYFVTTSAAEYNERHPDSGWFPISGNDPPIMDDTTAAVFFPSHSPPCLLLRENEQWADLDDARTIHDNVGELRRLLHPRGRDSGDAKLTIHVSRI